jgi:Uma2 family endonuclease
MSMFTAIVSRDQLQVSAGAVLKIPATWQEYLQIRQQRGDGSIPRIKYRHGEVLLMSPMAAHGRDASLLADVAKALLDHEGREFDTLRAEAAEILEQSIFGLSKA